MTIELPEDLPPEAMQAIEFLIQCCRDGLTGCLEIHYKDGIPQSGEHPFRRRFTGSRPQRA